MPGQHGQPVWISGPTGPPSLSWYLGQWSPENTATWLATYDPNFYAQCGGNNSLYQTGSYQQGYGSIDAVSEAAQRADALKVAEYFTLHPDLLAAERNAQSTNGTIQLGWVDDSKDVDLITSHFMLGTGLMDAKAALLAGGYADQAAATAIVKACALPPRDGKGYVCDISGVSNMGDLANVLGMRQAVTYLDPVLFVDQSTGQLSTTMTYWAYHIGGENVTIGIPFTSLAYEAATSFIRVAFMVRYDVQAAAILGALTTAFFNLQQFAVGLGVNMDTFCKMASGAVDVPFTKWDLVSPIPVTPDFKAWLGESPLFNNMCIVPPTYGGAFIMTIFQGVAPLVPVGTPNSHGVGYEGKTYPVAVNELFDVAVQNNFSAAVQEWLECDAGKLYAPPKDLTLQLLAKAYPASGS